MRYVIEIETDYPPSVIQQAFVEGWQAEGLTGEPEPIVKPAPGTLVLVTGSPFHSVMAIVGPFVDDEEVRLYAERTMPDYDDWWPVRVAEPVPDETKVVAMAPREAGEW